MEKPKIYLSSPHLGTREADFVKEAFDTNWVSTVGPNITAFERELAMYNKIDACAALGSGTAAIHLALIVLGVEAGDEVICSSFTFSASCNPIRYQGATPIFVDSEADTYNMDPVLLEEAIADRIKRGKKPKAIILVHLYGMPSKIKEILEVARKYEVPVVEDAAEALGSKYFGQALGTFGDLGIYSFNGNKIITTSGGGALVSRNTAWIEKARFLATQARDAAPHYQHSHIGYNYRLSNILAGIGRGQLLVLDERVAQRRKNYDFYRNAFADRREIQFLSEPQGFYSNRWLTTAVIKGRISREDMRLKLERENIESRPLWKPMHLQPIFEGCPAYTNGTSERLFNEGICLPSGSNMTTEELQRVADVIHSLLSH
ncbi:DegT/DnrJ/EryC1/StrS family aminotransferase [Pseudochryseolinea flava]|uniref:GDP-perosamine synthase n=1 Tax=Pseudochryseolinea flava TaxID=2059302 RepID=A0A364Y3I8_9BACT|nr:aminotransferase class I/II-fold pyridoxal phosphate-dependent enzyme [Pseudochryseolinea flava]RAW01282.1 pyridoxal phosphate-dependent aminotransferase [Pseudochryseolinea flava]